MDSEFWNKRYAETTNVWSITPNQFVVEYLSDLAPGSMIDLAGGEGRNALWFASRGWRAENADFSAVALEKFTERAAAEGLSERCFATLADATTETVYQLAPADLGLIAYLQIDAPGQAGAIASLAGALRSGGTFFGVWHARENLDGGYGGPQNPAVLPTQAELRESLEAAGLSDVHVQLREREVEVEGGIRVAIDVVARATKP